MERAEIASRLERAIRPSLSPSSASLFSSPASSSSSAPPLTELLSHLGPPDAPRCSHCRAELPRGPLSLLCFACGAFHNPSLVPTPSFASSVAYRRLLEALQIDDLEPNVQAIGEEWLSASELDTSPIISRNSSGSLKSTSNSPPLQETLGHKNSLSTRGLENVASESEPSEVSILTMTKVTATDSSYPTSELDPSIVSSEKAVSTITLTSEVSSSITSEKEQGQASEHAEKDPVLDYSTHLKGISLEDFFLGQTKIQDQPSVHSPAVVDPFIVTDHATSSSETSVVRVHKDTFFWDPLSESIIPDGEDLFLNSDKIFGNRLSGSKDHVQEGLSNVEDEDDGTWEGEFQSAAPATGFSNGQLTWEGGFASAAPSAETLSHTNDQVSYVSMAANLDLFANDPTERSLVDFTSNQGDRSKSGTVDLFTLQHGPENLSTASWLLSEGGGQGTRSQDHSDFNDLFSGPVWHQNVSMPPAIDVASGSLLAMEHESSAEVSPLNLGAEVLHQPADNSDRGFEAQIKELSAISGMQQQKSSVEDRNDNLVSSLLAQLPDLSFMLADKLIIKTNISNGRSHQEADSKMQSF